MFDSSLFFALGVIINIIILIMLIVLQGEVRKMKDGFSGLVDMMAHTLTPRQQQAQQDREERGQASQPLPQQEPLLQTMARQASQYQPMQPPMPQYQPTVPPQGTQYPQQYPPPQPIMLQYPQPMPTVPQYPPPPQPASQYPPPPQYQPQPAPPQYQPQPQPMPHFQPTPRPVAQTGSGAPQARSIENLFGRNILGILASVLVFTGLVFLGFLVVPLLTDTVRIVLMFLVSALLLAGGLPLNRRYSNNFTKALLGTGCGAFFISIMVTHLHFHAFNEIVAFSLLLVWLTASLLITRQSQSLLVGIITHAGMIFSVCAGYLAGLDDSRLLLLMVYQLLSTTLIVGGNIFCCRRMYRFGLFASLALVVFASSVMWERFTVAGSGFDSLLPVPLIAVAFLIQFIGSSFLSYLLLVSCIRVRDIAIQALLQGLNALLWVLALFLDVTLLVIKLLMVLRDNPADASLLPYWPLPWALVVSLLILVAAAFALMALRRRMAFNQAVETVTVLLLATAAAGLLLLHMSLHVLLEASGPSLSYLVVVAVLLMGARRFSNNRALSLAARIALGADGLFMLGNGFWELTGFGSIWLSIAYLVAVLALVWASYRELEAQLRPRYAVAVKLLLLILFQVALINILSQSTLEGSSFSFGPGSVFWPPSGTVPPPYSEYALFFLICSATLFIMMVCRRDTPLGFFRANEFIIMLGASCEIAWGATDAVSTILHVITALICFGMLLERIRRLARATAEAARNPALPQPKSGIEALGAFALTTLFLSLISSLTDWFSQTYSFSLAAMFIALVIVALGFWSRCKSLRLYGLILVLMSVLKLVTYDIRDLDSLMRVVSFISGGLICFGISALYNFAVKRFELPPPDADGGDGFGGGGTGGNGNFGGGGGFNGGGGVA